MPLKERDTISQYISVHIQTTCAKCRTKCVCRFARVRITCKLIAQRKNN